MWIITLILALAVHSATCQPTMDDDFCRTLGLPQACSRQRDSLGGADGGAAASRGGIQKVLVALEGQKAVLQNMGTKIDVMEENAGQQEGSDQRCGAKVEQLETMMQALLTTITGQQLVLQQLAGKMARVEPTLLTLPQRFAPIQNIVQKLESIEVAISRIDTGGPFQRAPPEPPSPPGWGDPLPSGPDQTPSSGFCRKLNETVVRLQNEIQTSTRATDSVLRVHNIKLDETISSMTGVTLAMNSLRNQVESVEPVNDQGNEVDVGQLFSRMDSMEELVKHYNLDNQRQNNGTREHLDRQITAMRNSIPTEAVLSRPIDDVNARMSVLERSLGDIKSGMNDCEQMIPVYTSSMSNIFDSVVELKHNMSKSFASMNRTILAHDHRLKGTVLLVQGVNRRVNALQTTTAIIAQQRQQQHDSRDISRENIDQSNVTDSLRDLRDQMDRMGNTIEEYRNQNVRSSKQALNYLKDKYNGLEGYLLKISETRLKVFILDRRVNAVVSTLYKLETYMKNLINAEQQHSVTIEQVTDQVQNLQATISLLHKLINSSMISHDGHLHSHDAILREAVHDMEIIQSMLSSQSNSGDRRSGHGTSSGGLSNHEGRRIINKLERVNSKLERLDGAIQPIVEYVERNVTSVGNVQIFESLGRLEEQLEGSFDCCRYTLPQILDRIETGVHECANTDTIDVLMTNRFSLLKATLDRLEALVNHQSQRSQPTSEPDVITDQSGSQRSFLRKLHTTLEEYVPRRNQSKIGRRAELSVGTLKSMLLNKNVELFQCIEDATHLNRTVREQRSDLQQCRGRIIVSDDSVGDSQAQITQLEEQLVAAQALLNAASDFFPRDCNDILACSRTDKTNGIYKVSVAGSAPFDVYCDMDNHGGGWTVIQRRMDGSENFNRTWADYRDGFGRLAGEMWIGNEKLHKLTHQKRYHLRIELEDFVGNNVYAQYDDIVISDERDGYRLVLGNYTGTAGDSLRYNNYVRFTTFDVDNDESYWNCAKTYFGGWWYKNCHYANLNGRYDIGQNTDYHMGIIWYEFKGFSYSLKRAEMKIRPVI